MPLLRPATSLPQPPRGHGAFARRAGAVLALVTGLGAASLPLADSAAAATVDVTDYDQLVAAVGPACHDGDVVRAGANILAPGNFSVLTVSCSLTLDINARYLQLGPVVITPGRTLTIDDPTNPTGASGAGQVFINANTQSFRAGIQTTGATLVVRGGLTTAIGGSSSAGVGGSGTNVDTAPGAGDAGTLRVTGGTLFAGTSGTNQGAGIGGAIRSSGGVVEISGGRVGAGSGDQDNAGYGAGIGAGGGGAGTPGLTAGTITISGNASVFGRSWRAQGAGIGGSDNGGGAGTITIRDDAQVTATGGEFGGAGIGSGGGAFDPAATTPTILIEGSPTVTTTTTYGAGIGGGRNRSGGSITITGGTISTTATADSAGRSGAGVGAGAGGPSGGTVAIGGTAQLTASVGRGSAALGGGYGANNPTVSDGSDLTISSSRLVRVSGGNAVGAPADGGGAFGRLDLRGTLQIDPPPALTTSGGGLTVRDSLPGDEVVIGSTGVLRGSNADGTGGEGAFLAGPGQVLNNGTILLATDRVTAPVKGRHYRLTLDPRGGAVSAGSVTVFAASISAGARTLPTPTRDGYTFVGWNTAADGSGTTVDAGTLLTGIAPPSSTGSAVVVPLFARWTQVPTITGGGRVDVLAGDLVDYRPTVTGEPAPVVSLQQGVLPRGLSLNPSTGAITGQAREAGVFPVTLRAANAAGTADLAVTLTVNAEPGPATITGPGVVTGFIGEPVSYRPTVRGYPVPLQTLTGTLPEGLTFDPATGSITGTPAQTLSTPLSTIVTITATNDLGSASTQVRIDLDRRPAAPTLSAPDTMVFVSRLRSGYRLNVTGYPEPTVGLAPGSAPLPAGLVIETNPVLGGLRLAGQPTVRGFFTVTLQATNASGSADVTVTLDLRQSPVITDLDAVAVLGEPFEFRPTVSGIEPFSYALFNAAGDDVALLAPGLSFDAATGVISGTPTELGTTSYLYQVRADRTGTNAPITITVGTRPTISGADSATGDPGRAFSYTPVLGGSPAPTVTADRLPAGLSLDATTGVISGTPTAPGATDVVLTATNVVGTATQRVRITVTGTPAGSAPTLAGSATAAATVGTAFTYTPAVGGDPAPTVSTTSPLPPGLTLAPATGVLSGTPTATGTFPITLRATNASGTADLAVTVTVRSRPVITGPATAGGTVGTAFRYAPSVTGTPAPSVTANTLPPGLKLAPTTGLVVGTPTRAGTYRITLTASNAAGTDDHVVTITIDAAAACSDGKDNDGNGVADFPQDLGCTSATDTTEANPGTAQACGTARPIRGTAAADTLSGTARADLIDAAAGRDTVEAGDGNDCVYAGTGDDSVKAGAGNDRVNLQGGADTLDAGAGNDVVVAADGTKDVIVCGAGSDTVIADRIDVLTACEDVTRA